MIKSRVEFTSLLPSILTFLAWTPSESVKNIQPYGYLDIQLLEKIVTR